MKQIVWLILLVLIVPVSVWAEFTPGNIYVADWNNKNVWEYDKDWNLVSSWTHPAFKGKNIGGMAFDADGNLVVAARTQFCVFSAPGVEVGCYPSGLSERLENIIFDTDGYLYTTTSSYGSPIVRKYDKDYQLVTSFPMPTGSLTGITCDVDQNLYVASQNAGAIYKMDRVSGSILDTIPGLKKSAYGIEGLQITHDGDLLVAQYATGVLRIDTTSPLYIYDVITAPTLKWPVPVTIDNEGRIYAGDFENGYGSQPADLFTWDVDGNLLPSRISSEVYGPFGMVVAGTTLPCGAFQDPCARQGGDADKDGICDNQDVCLETQLPDELSRNLGVNRWIADSGGVFQTSRQGKGNGPDLSFTLEDTAGCSCTQIIEKLELGKGHSRFGCSISAMRDWVDLNNNDVQN